MLHDILELKLRKDQTVIAVEVEQHGYDYETENTFRKILRYLIKDVINPFTGGEKSEMVYLNKYFTTSDSAVIIGDTKILHDGNAAELVEKLNLPLLTGYRDYTKKCVCFFQPLSSLWSAIIVAGGVKEKNYLIILKK